MEKIDEKTDSANEVEVESVIETEVENNIDIRGFFKKIKKQFTLRKIVDGTFVASDNLLKYWKMIVMVFSLALLLIALNYEGEKRARNVTKIKTELKELHFLHMATKTELMSVSSQSYLAGKLDTLGIKESVVPPAKLVKGASYGKRD